MKTFLARPVDLATDIVNRPLDPRSHGLLAKYRIRKNKGNTTIFQYLKRVDQILPLYRPCPATCQPCILNILFSKVFSRKQRKSESIGVRGHKVRLFLVGDDPSSPNWKQKVTHGCRNVTRQGWNNVRIEQDETDFIIPHAGPRAYPGQLGNSVASLDGDSLDKFP